MMSRLLRFTGGVPYLVLAAAAAQIIVFKTIWHSWHQKSILPVRQRRECYETYKGIVNEMWSSRSWDFKTVAIVQHFSIFIKRTVTRM